MPLCNFSLLSLCGQVGKPSIIKQQFTNGAEHFLVFEIFTYDYSIESYWAIQESVARQSLFAMSSFLFSFHILTSCDKLKFGSKVEL